MYFLRNDAIVNLDNIFLELARISYRILSEQHGRNERNKHKLTLAIVPEFQFIIKTLCPFDVKKFNDIKMLNFLVGSSIDLESLRS